ncbi:hypothetical protein NDU88_002199 [Pleurodeles waltl]|uniref:Uncharacterized protein n=1 Tax=Pleurodeles waltl TaxID=8319 RepID=A0AAV7QB04_PLEWA|nr:hypothetical protein NDU88_002199 [Pleurodeles waltl]
MAALRSEARCRRPDYQRTRAGTREVLRTAGGVGQGEWAAFHPGKVSACPSAPPLKIAAPECDTLSTAFGSGNS